jgi:hypothetical protein
MMKQREWLRHCGERAAEAQPPQIALQRSGEHPAPPRPQLRPTVYRPSPPPGPMHAA